MKPSPQITDETSKSLQNYIYESNNVDCCNLNIYEFQEGEDLYGSRSLGYQKPKHMWMAKDQAFTNSKPTSPNATVNYSDFGVDLSSDQKNADPQNSVDRCVYEVNPTYTVESLCPNNNVQGFSVALSSYTNTSSSLSSHTPPSTNEIISSCTSPSSSELHSIKSDCTNGISKCSLKTKISLNGKFKNKNKKLTSNILSTESLSCLDSVLSTQERRNRKAKSSRKNRNSVKSNVLTLKISNSLSNGQMSMDESVKEELYDTELLDVPKSPLTIASSPLVGGLKIRLRRDSGIIDSNVCRGKKSKMKSDSTVFRIVESWCDADAPGGEYSRRVRAITGQATLSPTFNLASGGLRVGDIVWAKLAGYPYWPSQISAIWARTVHQLSQATLLPISQLLDNNSASLAILATPDDPALASGYTAKVEWFAWDQCSYLSCAKLFPFKEAFDKLYNPRTRVKGYAEAIRLAKQYINGTCSSHCDNTDLQTINSSPPNKSHSSGQFSAPPSTDSQWSAMTTLSSSLEPSIPGLSSSISRDNSDTNRLSMHVALSYDQTQSSMPLHSSDVVTSQSKGVSLDNPFCVTNGMCGDSLDLPDLGNMPLWAPLPQLDVSGLGVLHVPSFSEDEEDFDQPLVNPLEFDFGSCI